MTDPLTEEEIRTLRSILRGLSASEWRALKAIASGIVGAMGGTAPAGTSAPTGGRVASDYEMSGQYGDPTVRKDPKRWAGASYSGASYSQCPTDYLLTLADFLEWKAGQEQKKPDPKKHANGKFYWEFDLKDAALARGWAARNRGKDLPPPAPPADDDGTGGAASSDDITMPEEEWVPT